jgi:hypothetical protein
LDFGTHTSPSENLAIAQDIIDTVSPDTRRILFEISTGIFTKGIKNTGKKTIVTKIDQKEILSRSFDDIE